jgi:hypothetical protein
MDPDPVLFVGGLSFFAYYFLKVLHPSSKIKSHKEVEVKKQYLDIKVFLTFLRLMMEGSGRPKNVRIQNHNTDFWESKWHISALVRLSQPFTALKIIKKVEQSVLEEAILSLDMPTIDQLLG